MSVEDESYAEEVAEAIIRRMQENGRWEALRVELASTLRMNNDFKLTENRAQEILATDGLKKLMKQPTTTEYDVAQMVEKAGGLQRYESALIDVLDVKRQIGEELKREVGELVDQHEAGRAGRK